MVGGDGSGGDGAAAGGGMAATTMMFKFENTERFDDIASVASSGTKCWNM